MSQEKNKKKSTGFDIDKTLQDLYTSAKEDFEKKLLVAKEMVKLEMARLKQAEEEPGGEGLRD